MNKKENIYLSSSQFACLLIGFTLGPEFLRLPNILVGETRQDGWISAIIGLIYPFYIVLISGYIIKNNPDTNILKLSKKHLGKFIGSLLNFIFLLQFVLYTGTITSSYISISKVYIVEFLSPFKIGLIGVALSAYAANKGLKTLSKANELITGMLLVIIILSIWTLKDGSFLNIEPVFGSGVSSILKASLKTSYSYMGFESILLFYSYVKDKKTIVKASLKSVTFVGVTCVWTVFATIFYLGIDIIPKSHWSFLLVYDSITFPIINNFRYVFMFVWTLVVFRILAGFNFAISFIVNDFINIDIKKLCLYISPLILYIGLKMNGSFIEEKIQVIISPVFVLYNILYISLIALLSFIKNLKRKTAYSS